MAESDSTKTQIDSLPEIGQIVIPDTMKVMSTKIRWLDALGYSRVEIQRYYGLRYQQVRNVLATTPKRAAREDLPPLIIELREPVDDIQAIMDEALEHSLAVRRHERKGQNNSED